MKKITQDTEFMTDIIVGSGGIKYALTNKINFLNEDNETVYQADALEIKHDSEAKEVIKNHFLNTIVTDEINGNKFYADNNSRIDLLTILVLKLSENLAGSDIIATDWKCLNGKVSNLTIKDFKDAVADSIEKKGRLVL